MASTISQERHHSVKIDQERQSYEQFRLKDLAVGQAVALHKLRVGESDRDMAKGKHQKAIKFTLVTGGSQLVYRGGWSNGTVVVPSLYVGSNLFVFADLSSGFGQLVFGRKKNRNQRIGRRFVALASFRWN